MGLKNALRLTCGLLILASPRALFAQSRPLQVAPPRLRVAADHRHLACQDGRPFFYLGDTAWELFHRLTREDADFYLENRAKKGFTVIQAVALAEFDGIEQPNAYGHKPLIDRDPTRPAVVDGPDNDYWDHVDYIVNKAASLGLYIGMLPTWGDKWSKKWGQGPETFTPENARQYGRWLGTRYRDKPIIWILGGDRNPENDRHLAIIRALAAGLAEGDGHSHLMTYHPQGESRSSKWFQKDDWLDFNAFQSGHARRDIPNYEFTLADRALTPIKPTLDAEPRYEDHPINWDPKNGWFDDADVRQAAYWSMLAGACGHTYGDHNIWQFLQPGRDPVSHARTRWKTALNHPGSYQVGYMRRLFESRPWTRLVPDESLVTGDPGKGGEHIRAARAEDGSFAFIYTPAGRAFSIHPGKLSGSKLNAWWFDPRKAEAIRLSGVPRGRETTFTPPGELERGNDWILVLDDASAGYPAPGTPAG
jgi:hypothetical protein